MLHLGLDLCVNHNKIVIMYFSASLSFLVVGLSLSFFTQTIGTVPPLGIRAPPSFYDVFHPYLDLGLRLFGFGIFLVVATFYQSLVGEGKSSQKQFSNIRHGSVLANLH
jgi:hypothetical protein